MPVRASVQPLPDPGHAILRLTELQASPDGLTLSIQRQQGPDSHLSDDGWRRTETWLQPARVRRVKDVLEFDLGPEICDRLAGVATVRLRVKEPDIGVVSTTVVAWPTMLTSGAATPGSQLSDDTVRLKRLIKLPPEEAPVVEPPPPPPPEPEPVPELRAERPLVPPAEPGSTREWLIAAVLLIVAIGAGYWAYTNYFQTKPEQQATTETPATTDQPSATAAAELPKKSVRDTVNEYFAGKPAPEAMYAKGKEFATGGDLSAAFLVWRRAAEAGNVQAQVEMAAFYDPVSPQPKSSFTPDGARAAEWYERAALAGNVDAQRRYGLLLAKGGPGLPADVAKAKIWLQQAAAQNDADAKKALDALPK